MYRGCRVPQIRYSVKPTHNPFFHIQSEASDSSNIQSCCMLDLALHFAMIFLEINVIIIVTNC